VRKNIKSGAGFTLIELIVVIAIIAILAAIVVVNVNGYISKAKVARAKIEAKSIGDALDLFYMQYGHYPYMPMVSDDTSSFQILPTVVGGSGEPYWKDSNENKHYLSDFYKISWTSYNASSILKNGYYGVVMMTNEDGIINCGYVDLYGQYNGEDGVYYGSYVFLNNNCDPGDMGEAIDNPFSIKPVYY